MSRIHGVRALVLALFLLPGLTACGAAETAGRSSPDAATSVAPSADPAAGDASRFPVAVAAANGEVTIDRRPEAIVSLSPTASEMLYAMGAGPQVVAVDEFSTFPSEAPTTDLSGFEPNVEAIAGYEPDLVIVQDDSADLTGALGGLDVPVLVAPAATTLADSYRQIEMLGAATGHEAEAAAVVERMRGEIERIVADLPETDAPLTYYHELDDTYFTVTSDTFIGEIYELAGLVNIADEAGTDAGGYPQLSEEFIIDANPDLIFLADTKCCGQSEATVAQRPGWDEVAAVRDGAVVPLDDDVASRWGPRVVDLLRTVADAVAEHADA